MFFRTGQKVEGVDLGLLKGNEANGDHATITIKHVWRNDDDQQWIIGVDSVYGREYDVDAETLNNAAS